MLTKFHEKLCMKLYLFYNIILVHFLFYIYILIKTREREYYIIILEIDI